MTRDEIVAAIRVNLGDAAGDVLDGTRLLAAANYVWQFDLVDLVPGTFREGEVRFALVPGQETYDLESAADVGAANAGMVRATQSDLWILGDTIPLCRYTRTEDFWSEWDREDTAQGRPTEVLVRGSSLTFRPIPDQAYTAVVPCQLYREELEADGIANSLTAEAVIRGATAKVARDLGYDDIAQRYDAAFPAVVARMRARSLARPTSYRLRADF
jgi:hypothetical protein